MGHISGNREDNVAESNIDCDGPAQMVSEENISKQPRDSSCDILAKSEAAFCNYPKVCLRLN